MKEQRDFQKRQVNDWKEMLYPDVGVIKPRAPQAVIPKEHFMTDFEIDKLYEKYCGPGPQSFDINHKLTEKRNDMGVVKFVADTESTDASEQPERFKDLE